MCRYGPLHFALFPPRVLTLLLVVPVLRSPTSTFFCILLPSPLPPSLRTPLSFPLGLSTCLSCLHLLPPCPPSALSLPWLPWLLPLTRAPRAVVWPPAQRCPCRGRVRRGASRGWEAGPPSPPTPPHSYAPPDPPARRDRPAAHQRHRDKGRGMRGGRGGHFVGQGLQSIHGLKGLSVGRCSRIPGRGLFRSTFESYHRSKDLTGVPLDSSRTIILLTYL